MKHNIYSHILASATMVALAGCDKEANFMLQEGQLNGKAVAVDYVNSGTRASNINIGEFIVNLVNTQTNEIEKSYTYSEMPEVVTLPVGEYRAEAVYGENKIAEWENPFYKGATTFKIEAGEITDHVDPIECELKNIKVEVDILDETGFDIVGEDVQVVVNAGKSGELTYDTEHLDSIGYFRYDTGSYTIIAELSGTIDGLYTDGVRRVYDNAAAGNSYKIRFHIQRPDNTNPGDIQIGNGITVDASIEIKDENHIIDPNEPENPIIDDMRPVNGDETNPDDPGKDPGNDPTPGDDPQPASGGPTIIPEGFELGVPYVVSYDEESDEEFPEVYTPVKFKVTSETGINEFKIHINSSTLTQETLESVQLSSKLNLVNPGEYKEALENLGFPTGDNVKGQTSIDFDISKFVPLLGLLGSGDHEFEITVSDQSGTTTGTIYLRN